MLVPLHNSEPVQCETVYGLKVQGITVPAVSIPPFSTHVHSYIEMPQFKFLENRDLFLHFQ